MGMQHRLLFFIVILSLVISSACAGSAPPPVPPEADFSASSTSGESSLDVQFTDQSTGEATSWAWDFGDGRTSAQQSPSHIYQTAGMYAVSLEVTGPGGSDTETKTDHITVTPPAAEIVRDDYGIPTITAATDEELFELWGYAVAEDRLWQLEGSRRWARGMLAEVFGGDTIAVDKYTRLLGYTEEEYVSIFNTMSPEAQEMVEAYVAGINRRIEEVMADPDNLLPFEFKGWDLIPTPWKISDSLAMVTASVRTFGMIGGTELAKAEVLEDLMGRYDITTAQGMFNDLFWLNDSSAPAVTELAPSVTQPLDGELSHASLVGVEGATAEFDQLVKEALEYNFRQLWLGCIGR
jgi:PKD repeat protein